ncbi:MAG: hypothetical protein JXA90_14665, partial [Planctomycetes bacterium]|nr:hypothetical protein [Planctomycetota bacterium]
MRSIQGLFILGLLLCAVFRGRAAGESPPGPEFLEAWYLEVAAGSFEEAARQYEAIYLRRPPAARASADRERAAYRAGCCYEALGKEGLAALAYDWLDRSGVEDSLLRRRAQARL